MSGTSSPVSPFLKGGIKKAERKSHGPPYHDVTSQVSVTTSLLSSPLKREITKPKPTSQGYVNSVFVKEDEVSVTSPPPSTLRGSKASPVLFDMSNVRVEKRSPSHERSFESEVLSSSSTAQAKQALDVKPLSFSLLRKKRIAKAKRKEAVRKKKMRMGIIKEPVNLQNTQVMIQNDGEIEEDRRFAMFVFSVLNNLKDDVIKQDIKSKICEMLISSRAQNWDQRNHQNKNPPLGIASSSGSVLLGTQYGFSHLPMMPPLNLANSPALYRAQNYQTSRQGSEFSLPYPTPQPNLEDCSLLYPEQNFHLTRQTNQFSRPPLLPTPNTADGTLFCVAENFQAQH